MKGGLMDWNKAFSEGILSGMTLGVISFIIACFRWMWVGFKIDLAKWKLRRSNRLQQRIMQPAHHRKEPPIKRTEPPVRR
jgi:hypothetical protein